MSVIKSRGEFICLLHCSSMLAAACQTFIAISFSLWLDRYIGRTIWCNVYTCTDACWNYIRLQSHPRV